MHVPSWAYDLIYRKGAPWEMGPRPELVEQVESGVLAAEALPPGRAIDLGCGTGANAVFLAEHGFEVTGVDLSAVALRKAREAAGAAGVDDRTRWVHADLTKPVPERYRGAFDLLADYGTLDDLRSNARQRMAALMADLARPGAKVLLWCFYADPRDLPLITFDGASKLSGAVRPGEERELFAEHFDIERLPEPAEGSGFACFLMTRREETRGTSGA
ncbi:MAG: class I SAM-dependent methyltransferase [Actinomycetota bacterium]